MLGRSGPAGEEEEEGGTGARISVGVSQSGRAQVFEPSPAARLAGSWVQWGWGAPQGPSADAHHLLSSLARGQLSRLLKAICVTEEQADQGHTCGRGTRCSQALS